jgi:hypothetical protein
MKSEGGLEWGDLIQVWIGLAVSASAFFAWLTYRITKGGFFLNLPHLVAHIHVREEPRRISATLRGAGNEQWDIVEARVVSPRSVKLISAKCESDRYGGVVWSEETVVGRSMKNPKQYFYVSSIDRPVKLRCKLALKASPSITSFRTATISKND